MTIPNKITIGRILATPLFLILFLLSENFLAKNHQQAGQIMAVLIVVLWLLMEISDVVDGYLARKWNLVSDLGKIMDPFSDVISRTTYFFLFVQVGFLPAWPLIVIFWRELSITFVRAVLNKTGVSLGANSGGKTKAVFYFLTSFLGMILFLNQAFHFFGNPLLAHIELVATISFIVSAGAAIFSFIIYLKGFLKTDYMQKVINE